MMGKVKYITATGEKELEELMARVPPYDPKTGKGTILYFTARGNGAYRIWHRTQHTIRLTSSDIDADDPPYVRVGGELRVQVDERYSGHILLYVRAVGDIRSSKATVEVIDEAKLFTDRTIKMKSRDFSQVEAHGNVTIHAFDYAKVKAYDETVVHAFDETKVTAYDKATVFAYNKAWVVAHPGTRVILSDCARVRSRRGVKVLRRIVRTTPSGRKTVVYADRRTPLLFI